MIERVEDQNEKNILGDNSSVSSDNDSRSNIAQCDSSQFLFDGTTNVSLLRF